VKATTPTHARTARVASIVRSLSLRIRVCHPNTRLHVRLLGPCFKTGRSRPNHGDHCALLLSSAAHCNPKVTSRMPSLLQPHPAIPTQNTSTGLPHRAHPSMHPALSRDRFPFNNFTCYLTPFSRCFSSFPHGTCSLSVSCPYLAFDGIYHPFELHSQATRLVEHKPYVTRLRVKDGIVTLYDTLFKKIYTRAVTGFASLGYNSIPEGHRFSL